MASAAAAAMSLLFLLVGSLLHRESTALSFNFTSFPPNNTPNITFEGTAMASVDGFIELSRNQADANLTDSRGWAVYSHPVRLWDATTRNLTDFTTTFSFFIRSVTGLKSGHGIAFFLAPSGTSMPNGTRGGPLALFGDGGGSGHLPDPGRIVAVEFDTYKNFWDPPNVHVGIDVGSIVSVVNVSWATFAEWGSGSATVDATVAYRARTKELSARFSGGDGTSRNVSYVVDLRELLPEWATIGFSASTGSFFEIHRILSWSFYSTLGDGDGAPGHNSGRARLLVGLVSGFGLLAALSGIFWFILWRRKMRRWRREGSPGKELVTIDNSEIDEGRGCRRFTYRELVRATRSFPSDGKLGRGGFGEVYKGLVSDMGLEVAVKRVARDSKQGKKEYLSEINIISRLRHRNLVKLVGWCHDRGELLLVYEYLPNGSLDAHLFGAKAPPLSWPVRYKIAQGLAAALLYLHEGWEQCVVHRDVKSSNVMLDAEFNSKLGDFGLARLVDHGVTMQTTVPAGTWGYLAPECATAGKASKESDVYSFGVVALEIACGRKAFDPTAGEGKLMLVGWVWGLYGQRALLEAADERIRGEFDQVEMERLMEVGLWCAQPELSLRPTMSQVVASLSFESSPPKLTYAPLTSASLWQPTSTSTTTAFSSTTGGSHAIAASPLTSSTSTAISEASGAR